MSEPLFPGFRGYLVERFGPEAGEARIPRRTPDGFWICFAESVSFDRPATVKNDATDP